MILIDDYLCKTMKSLTKHLTFNIKSRRGFVNITPDIRKLVEQSQVQEGLCLVNAMHITASVFINDNEDGFKIACVKCEHGPQNHDDEFRAAARKNESQSQKRDADFG